MTGSGRCSDEVAGVHVPSVYTSNSSACLFSTSRNVWPKYIDNGAIDTLFELLNCPKRLITISKKRYSSIHNSPAFLIFLFPRLLIYYDCLVNPVTSAPLAFRRTPKDFMPNRMPL
jgi:hypothetical protein